jgi:hypothetical protein
VTWAGDASAGSGGGATFAGVDGGDAFRFFGSVETTITTAKINTIDTSNSSQFTAHPEKHKDWSIKAFAPVMGANDDAKNKQR